MHTICSREILKLKKKYSFPSIMAEFDVLSEGFIIYSWNFKSDEKKRTTRTCILSERRHFVRTQN